MGTYASDDSDDEGSVVSVVRHGELASVVERRATQIRHVLRDGPPDSEEDTPPAVRVRRGDLDPFALQRRASAGTSSRVDAGRGPSRLSKRGEKHASRDRHVVWRDERTTEGDPRGLGRDRGIGTGVVDDRSPSRLRRGIATRTATRTSPRPSRTFTTTHRPRYSPHPSSPSPGASPRSRGDTKTRGSSTRSLSRMSPSSAGAAAEPLAGRLRSERARLRAKRRGRRARGAGRRRARPARRARALGGEDSTLAQARTRARDAHERSRWWARPAAPAPACSRRWTATTPGRWISRRWSAPTWTRAARRCARRSRRWVTAKNERDRPEAERAGGARARRACSRAEVDGGRRRRVRPRSTRETDDAMAR